MTRIWTVLAVALWAGPGIADGALDAKACTTCHGAAGHSPGAIPSLTGQSAGALRDMLTAYRDGTQPGTIMPRLVAPLTDAEIAALSDTIAEWD